MGYGPTLSLPKTVPVPHGFLWNTSLSFIDEGFGTRYPYPELKSQIIRVQCWGYQWKIPGRSRVKVVGIPGVMSKFKGKTFKGELMQKGEYFQGVMIKLTRSRGGVNFK